MAFYDGNDNEIPADVMMDEFANYVTFKEAAAMIDPFWTSHRLHKEKVNGRIDMSKVMYVINAAMAARYPSTKGKKMFLHKSEVERFKREEYPKIKRKQTSDWVRICQFCRREMRDCSNVPCEQRKSAVLMDRAKQLGSKFELNFQVTPLVPVKKRGKR